MSSCGPYKTDCTYRYISGKWYAFMGYLMSNLFLIWNREDCGVAYSNCDIKGRYDNLVYPIWVSGILGIIGKGVRGFARSPRITFYTPSSSDPIVILLRMMGLEVLMIENKNDVGTVNYLSFIIVRCPRYPPNRLNLIPRIQNFLNVNCLKDISVNQIAWWMIKGLNTNILSFNNPNFSPKLWFRRKIRLWLAFGLYNSTNNCATKFAWIFLRKKFHNTYQRL